MSLSSISSHTYSQPEVESFFTEDKGLEEHRSDLS